MNPNALRRPSEAEHVLHTTLLDLVVRATEATSDEDAAVAFVLQQLRSGRASLTGNFRGAPIEALDPNGAGAVLDSRWEIRHRGRA